MLEQTFENFTDRVLDDAGNAIVAFDRGILSRQDMMEWLRFLGHLEALLVDIIKKRERREASDREG